MSREYAVIITWPTDGCVEGAGPLPAFLLDLGASYLSSNYPLPFPGREQGDATKFDSMNLINTVRVKEINDERLTESGAGAKHRHQVSDRRNSNERGSDTSSGRGQPGVRYADRWRRRGRLRRVGVRSERGVCGHWSARLRRSSWCGPRLLCREPGRRGRRRGSGGREPAAAPVVRHGTARARAAPRRRRGGLVAARGGRRGDALGGIRPRYCPPY